VAREFDALVVTDDVYDMLRWQKDPKSTKHSEAIPPRLVDVDRYLDGGSEREGADGFGNVASNMTVSKIAGRKELITSNQVLTAPMQAQASGPGGLKEPRSWHTESHKRMFPPCVYRGQVPATSSSVTVPFAGLVGLPLCAKGLAGGS
jgi:hypothetical protein